MKFSIAARNAIYYELKNLGIQQAAGDVIILLDSDVIPESDWLENLLASFDNPAVQVVGCNCYIKPTSVYAKSFALGWLFPLRAEGGPLRKARSFYANGVAFRGELIRRFPFPSIDGSCRGGGHLLASKLMRSGITIYRSQDARTVHPAPRPRHFMRRSVAQGRDNLQQRRLRAHGLAVPFGDSFRDASRRAGRALRRIRRKRERVNLSAMADRLALFSSGSDLGPAAVSVLVLLFVAARATTSRPGRPPPARRRLFRADTRI